MNAMRINVAQFIKEYEDAVAANLSSKELAELLGIKQPTLWHRVEQCRRHGIKLPPLRGGYSLSRTARSQRKRRRNATIRKAAVSKASQPRPPRPTVVATPAAAPDGFQIFVGTHT